MQKRFVDVTEEIKILVEDQDSIARICVVYQGPFGYEVVSAIGRESDWQDAVKWAERIARYPETMEALRGGQHLARLVYSLQLEQGITRTARDLNDLDLIIRVQHAGETRQASPEELPFPYDKPTHPLSDRRYSIEVNRLHLQLDNNDQISFIGTAKAGRTWNNREYITSLLTDFAVKRLFEIYKSDTSSFSHLAWVIDLNFAADLGV
ncbi:hypothetical protein PPL19_04060 [Pseudomonas psychrotolerans L19]|uniref:hypothetical protein n=1 Tax=Pseudomonas oryzihabitans TaxID=47885 RepID=UPI00023A50D1|nr:hypothetical protein [Pseudomonas psychrotolerans]EHK72081.1 hypothetical protein PPL19_04060 [Pseudomonas psychrotolerans L19]